MQIVYESDHTSESYVIQQGWHEASIERCPKCRGGIRSHGSYERKVPSGTRIARFYCRPCGLTVSLLPDFLAAGYSDTLAVQKAALAEIPKHETFDAAARAARPDIELQGARRWLRRRLHRFTLTLLLAATAAGVPIESVDVFSLRSSQPHLVASLPSFVGLRHQRLSYWKHDSPKQQPMGPDPPTLAALRLL